MATLTSDLLRHFDFSSETVNLTRSKISRSSTIFVFFGPIGKQDGRPGLWLTETFSTSPLKPLNGIQRTLTGSKISRFSTKFVLYVTIGKTRWPPWPLIGWDIFDFSSETVEWNSMKLDRKQDLNVLYQVVFWPIGKTRWLPSDWLRHFTFPLKPLNRIQRNWTGSRFSTSPTKFVFFGPIEKKNEMAALASDWLRHFDFSSETAERNSMKLDRKQDLNILYPFVFMCRSEKKTRWQPDLWLAETFSTSPLKPLNGIQRNLTWRKI